MDGIQWRQTGRTACPIVMILIGIACNAPPARSSAAFPRVTFDISRTIECRDVTPDEFAWANPDEKVIEARFQVSVLLLQGEQDDIEELIVTLFSPERRLQVVDFEPKMQLVSDIVGEVEKVDTSEVERSITASVGGVLSAAYGIGKAEASPSAGAGKIQREGSTETYKQIPAKQLVLVSGTANSEHGVFFKLRPSAQTSLEGTQQFTCRWAVPRAWRGDWALVTCQARGYAKTLFSENLKRCGQKHAPVALYLRGDSAAKQAATAMVRAQAARSATAGKPKPAAADWKHVVLKPILGARGTHITAAPSRLACATGPTTRVDGPHQSARRAAGAAGKVPVAASKRTDALGRALATLRQLSGSG